MAGNKKAETRVSAETQIYLQDILDTGTYGSNMADVVRSLIEVGIRDAIAKDIIVVRRRPVTSSQRTASHKFDAKESAVDFNVSQTVELVDKLTAMGIPETSENIANKIARGVSLRSFSFNV